ncbi:OmpA family protein [uncultured Hyphomonas sp.]|uniref:OmpA family protein n=1 Tax=uncultured Hyphomonas sp. TaxID=225298 RepID=UPI002AABCB2C|nr:OmpA family protein [uncultured Hyphomonas sp.]
MALAMRMVTGAAAVLALAACSGQDSAPTAQQATSVAEADCIPISDGTYQIRNGKILVMRADASSRPEPAPITDMSGQPVGWAAKLEQSFATTGYPWLGLQVRDGVAAVVGTAPGLAARDVSFLTAKAAIQNDPEGAEKVGLIVNAMAVEGREDTLGAGLTRLMNSDLTLNDCQDAFNQTLRVDDIDFPVNMAVLNAAELPVADTATGIARLCTAYNIEIAEHTDSRGSDSYNLQLSRQRAEAIRAYMIERGVDEAVLTAKGYGESQPVDSGTSAAARDRNERTEFIVTPR